MQMEAVGGGASGGGAPELRRVVGAEWPPTGPAEAARGGCAQRRPREGGAERRPLVARCDSGACEWRQRGAASTTERVGREMRMWPRHDHGAAAWPQAARSVA